MLAGSSRIYAPCRPLKHAWVCSLVRTLSMSFSHATTHCASCAHLVQFRASCIPHGDAFVTIVPDPKTSGSSLAFKICVVLDGSVWWESPAAAVPGSHYLGMCVSTDGRVAFSHGPSIDVFRVRTRRT